MNKTTAYLLLIVVLLSAACGAFQASGTDDLAGTVWVLVSINGDADQVGSPPTLVFEGEKISGNAGCNSYQGSYAVEGDSLEIGPLARTEIYCQDPPGVMEQEDRFLEILSSAESLTLNDGSLLISGGGFQLDFRILE